MGDGRWTLRGIRIGARDTVRVAMRNTGMTAGQVVAQAIEDWANLHPEAMVAQDMTDQNELADLLQELRNQFARYRRQLMELDKYVRAAKSEKV